MKITEITEITAVEEKIITDMSRNNKFIANPIPETIMDEHGEKQPHEPVPQSR